MYLFELKWRGRSHGIFHQYNSTEPGEVYTDSDCASDKGTRRSISCATMFAGGCLLYSSSRTQKLVSLSSAEAEVYACLSGVSDAIMLARLIAWMNVSKTTIHLHTGSSGAKGILMRQGVGKVRHLSIRILWLQDLISSGQVKLSTVPGALNPADIGTKRLPCNRLRSLMSMLGMFNLATGTVEGAEDPGAILRKKQNIMSILSVLGLLNLKGCDEDISEPSNSSFCVMAFTLLFGFLCMLAWKLMIMENVAPALSDEPDAEPAGMADPHHVDDGVDSSFAEVPSSSTDLPTAARPPQTHPALTAENYIAWMIERCSRSSKAL